MYSSTDFCRFLQTSIEKKGKILESKNLSNEQKAIMIADLSNEIMRKIRCLSLFIRKDYFSEFENGTSTTINPNDPRVKTFLDEKDNPNDFEQIHANSFGPVNPFLFFSSSSRFIFVGMESYMLREELEKYRAKEIAQLGGHDQSKEFPTYDSIEAPTIYHAVDLIQLLLSKQSIIESKDEIMPHHLCVLEHNFFPALAFNGNRISNISHIKTWAKEYKDILTLLLNFYEGSDGNVIIGHRDHLGYLCSYDGLFNVALSDGEKCLEGESTGALLEAYPDASIVGRKIVRSWFNHQLGGKGASALLDEKGTLWIGYVSPSSWRGDQWSADDQKILATWIHRLLSGLKKR